MPKRQGRPSAAQTPSPKSDKIVGSSKNKKGSASTSKGASKIVLSDKTTTALKKKLQDFKEKYPRKDNISLSDLKAVYRRGSGAFSGSHRPNMSRAGWAYARANKFLEKAAGKKVKAAYVQDDDLLKYEEGGSIESFKKVMYDNQSGSIVPYNAMYGKNEIYYKYKNALIKYSEIDKKWILLMIDNEKPQTIIGGYKTLKIAKEVALYYLKNPTKYEDGGLIAPNGKQSNLTPEQYKLVRTPEFKAWFGDWENDPENASKVLDENGEPLVVYHGQRQLLNKIKKIKVFKQNDYGYIYFAKNKEYVLKNFVIKGNLYECFLNIRNIIDGSEFECGKSYSELKLKNFYKRYGLNYLNGGLVENQNQKIPFWLSIQAKGKNFYGEKVYESISNQIINSKYEGFVFYETSFIPSKESIKVNLCSDKKESTLVYVALYPNQIKLADGSNTTFDSANPDIRYAEGGNVGQDITCRNCGWHWNTNQSNEYDKYVCHKCGFDNRTYYEPSPIGKYEKGGKINNMDNKKALNGSTGGMLVGNRHSEGGIKAINKSSNTPLEMEGGEVVITRNAVSDGSQREFEGKMMTNKEILSKINESGGGVSFAEGGKVHECACSGKHYKYGGRTMSDHDIVKEMREMYPNDFAKGVKEELSEHRKTLEELVNKKIKVSDAADLIVTEHLRKKPNYYKMYDKGGEVDLEVIKVTSFKDFIKVGEPVKSPYVNEDGALYYQVKDEKSNKIAYYKNANIFGGKITDLLAYKTYLYDNFSVNMKDLSAKKQNALLQGNTAVVQNTNK